METGHNGFPIQKRMIFYKFKVTRPAPTGREQVIAMIDVEIVKKGRFWMETS